MTSLLLLAAGLVLLIIGAEVLVRGASRLARALGLSPLVIGLTVVAYGTSAPEMAVSVMSGLTGQADLAVGNVVGSNVFNILFILGVSALIAPLLVSQQLIRLDVPLMIGVSLLVLALGGNGNLSRIEGFILFSGAVIYTVWLIYHGRKAYIAPQHDTRGASASPASPTTWPLDAVLIVAGLALLVLGSRWLVTSATSIARALAFDELVIGLTIVAAGTSLPEVATSVIASMRGERDIAVGNVVGSNIFNILAVLGLSSMLAPQGLYISDAALRFDMPVMIAVAIACLPIFFTGHIIARWEGGLFLAYYVAYTLYLWLAATQHSALAMFSTAMLGFVVPLTALTLLLITIRAIRSKRRVP